MISPSLWLIIAIIIVIGIIILILPSGAATKVGTIFVGSSVILAAYTLYRGLQTDEAANLQKYKEDTDKYHARIYELFMQNPELERMYRDIYGETEISADEHAVFHAMIQAIENIGINHNYEGIERYWFNAWKKWLKHKDFPLFWQSSHDEYRQETQNLVNRILSMK